ncbi:MAG: diguanylate cyclase [Planctomycetes bacterium]|nr:diguanylate cyclase [Planctomycetota bacterium]
MSFLLSLDGTSPGQRYNLGALTRLGGTAPDAVPAPGAAEGIEIARTDRLSVARSSKPFLVNGQEVTEHTLKSGDVIAAGTARFLFKSDETSTYDRRAPHLGALYRVAAVLTSGQDLSTSLGTALGVLLDETAARRAAAWLADDDTGKLERLAVSARDGVAAGWLEASYASLPALQNAVVALGAPAAATLVLPLVARSNVLGAIAVEGPGPGSVPDRDVELVTAVSLIATVAAENRRNAKQMEEYGRLLMSIEKATMWLSGYLERDPILGEAVGFARSIFKASHVSIAELEPDHKAARIVRAVTPRKSDPTAYLIKVGEGMLGRVLATGKPLHSPEPDTGQPPDGYARSKRFKTDSFAIVPIFASASEGADLLGAICVADKIGGRPFNERDLELLAVLARAVGVALHNARLYERATVDSLTRLVVRQHFFFKLEEHLASAQKSRRPLSLAIADLDDFKKVNDTHGHPAGDAVLRAVGAAVKRSLRPGDLGARYGGEEFALIFPGSTLSEARAACQAVLEAVRAAEIEAGDGAKIRITASIGLAELRGGDTPESLVARADAAQYRAKYGGKNRLVEADK